MKPGPTAALNCLERYIRVDASPRHAKEILREIAIGEAWDLDRDLDEACERWILNFISKIQAFLNDGFNLGSFQIFDLNSKNREYIQGSCFHEPQDSDIIKIAKSKRANTLEIYKQIRENSDEYLESTCRKMLTLLGVNEPHATPRSGDGGVDFYGFTNFGQIIKPYVLPPGSEKHLQIWFVGQAKKYNDNAITTKEIRELVGATQLARAKLFAGEKDPLKNFHANLCDPIFSIFVTSGRFSRDSTNLMRRSGIIPMDGPQLGQFLADHGVGIIDNLFNPDAFDAWLTS